MRAHRIGLLLSVAAAGGPAARADTFTFTIPGSVTVTSGSPVSQTVGGQPAATQALGYTLGGSWTAGSGTSWSNEFRVAVTAPGGTQSIFNPVGGTGDGNPFTFPGGPTSGGTFTNLAGPLPNYAAGSYTVSFDTTFAGSTANLAAGSRLTVFYNPQSLTGTTANGPTFNRPRVEGTALSTVGTAVRYEIVQVTVNQSGRYMLASGTPGYDGFLLLYRVSFDPASPLTNYVNGGDQPDDTTLPSVLTANLAVGTNYYAVLTGFDNPDAGAFTLYAAGPGAVTLTPVPEPALGLLSAALALGVSWWRSRRPG
jgi:hypothetical protein